MPGPPVLPTGKSVRLGEWNFTWTTKYGPSIFKLSEQQQDEIEEICKKSCREVIKPIVIDDIPYLTDGQAKTIRNSIARIGIINNGEIDKDRFTSVINECREHPSLWFLGSRDDFFDKCFKKDIFRQACIDTYHKGSFTQDTLLKEWHRARSGLGFVRSLVEASNSTPTVIQSEVIEDYRSPTDPICVECDESESETNEGSEQVDTSVNDSCRPGGACSSGGVCESGGEREPDNDEDCGVKFGFVETIEFDCDETVECISSGDVNVRACPAKIAKFDDHCLTHEPFKKNCETCAIAKRRRARFARGSASGKAGDLPFLSIDWVNPRVTASNGDKYALAVLYVQTGQLFCLGSKVKKDNVIRILDAARKEFGIENQKFELHSDGERVLGTEEVREYLVREGGVKRHGIPHCSNTNARIENAIKRIEDGTRCLLVQSGLPVKMWPQAAEYFCLSYNHKLGFSPRFNSVSFLPFGCFGRAVLPKGLRFRDKFSTRTSTVCFLGIDRTSSGGVRVLFPGADKKFRKSIVLSRDVKWEPNVYAFNKTTKNLKDILKALPEFRADNEITPWQAQCDTCNKWRFIAFSPERLDGREFHCVEIGVSCESDEDPRVYSELEGLSLDNAEEFDPESEGDGAFEIEEDEIQSDSTCSTEPSRKEKVIGRKARSDLAKGIAAVLGKKVEEVDDYELALNHLGVRPATQKDIDRIKHIIKTELKDDVFGGAVARVVIVPCKEALRPDNPDRPHWIGSLDSEVGSLIDEFGCLKPCHIDEVQVGDQLLPSVLIFSRKSDGRYKSRIVAAGCYEKVDSGNAYSSVVSKDAWVQALTLNASLGYGAYQIDVKNAFCQTDGSQVVGQKKTFVRPPKACNLPSSTVWQVIGSLYGLKSAPRAWKATLVTYLKEKGFLPSSLDDSVFVGPGSQKILVYVDDLIVLGPDSLCISFLTELRRKFTCTAWNDLSKASRESPLLFLGHEIFYDIDSTGKRVLVISQVEYARLLLARLGYSDCKIVKGLNHDDFLHDNLTKGPKASPEDHAWFRSVIGGLQYLCLGTRADIQSATSILAEGQSSPTQNHINTAKKVLRYLSGCADFELRIPIDPILPGQTVKFTCFYDANFGSERARNGGVICINNGTTSWWSRRQKSVVLSTAEAELTACAAAVRELIGARNFLASIYSGPQNGDLSFSLELRGDNVAATLIAGSQAGLRKVRHLTLADLFCRDVIEKENIKIDWVATDLNRSDCLTKVLGWQKIISARENLGLTYVSSEPIGRRSCVNTSAECCLWSNVEAST